MTTEFDLPPTNREPDNTYFDGQVMSYEFAVNGNRATLGVIQPGFKGIFPVAEGGEVITLVSDVQDAGLAIEIIDAEGKVEESRVLTHEGEHISAAEGKQMKLSTSGAVIKYVSVYSGQQPTAK